MLLNYISRRNSGSSTDSGYASDDKKQSSESSSSRRPSFACQTISALLPRPIRHIKAVKANRRTASKAKSDSSASMFPSSSTAEFELFRTFSASSDVADDEPDSERLALYRVQPHAHEIPAACVDYKLSRSLLYYQSHSAEMHSGLQQLLARVQDE